MAQSRPNNPQVIQSQRLVDVILDIEDKSPSLLSQCLQVSVEHLSNGVAVSVASQMLDAVEVAEGDPVGQETDVTVSRALMAETKSRNSVACTTEILEDSMESFRESIANEVVASHKRYSDKYIADLLKGSVNVADVNIADASSLALSDISAAASTVRFLGSLPYVYCSVGVYHQLRELESVAGYQSEVGLVNGLVWQPADLGSPSVSGDLVALVGDVSNHLVAADGGLRVNVTTESTAADAVNGLARIYSNHRFAVGEYGSSVGLSKITLV